MLKGHHGTIKANKDLYFYKCTNVQLNTFQMACASDQGV